MIRLLLVLFPLMANAESIDLLSYLVAHTQPPATSSTVEKYNRTKHFGGWVHQDPSNSCHDTREMVLAQENDPSVTLTFNSNGCTINTGLWHEPYTGSDVKSASSLQIDHVVPLEVAYYAGAYAWSGPVRCNYANFIANSFHLRAVSGHENMKKGDHGPDGYLPPSQADLCDYVSSWMKIKVIWELTATTAEVAAIQNVIQEQNCDLSFTTMDQNDLTQQRSLANTPIDACQNFVP